MVLYTLKPWIFLPSPLYVPHPTRKNPLPHSCVRFPSVASAGAVVGEAEGILGLLTARGLEGSFLNPKIPSQGKWASWHWPWPSSPWRRGWGGPITTGGSDCALKPIKLMPCMPDSWGQETFSGRLRAPLGERLCWVRRLLCRKKGLLGHSTSGPHVLSTLGRSPPFSGCSC